MMAWFAHLFHKHTWTEWEVRGSKYDCDGEWEERHCTTCKTKQERSNGYYVITISGN